MIDTHAHIYAEHYKDDQCTMIENAFKQGVNKIFMPNIDESSIEGMMALEEKYPGKCFSMMGLHPCSVNKDYKNQIKNIERWLDKKTFSAIGEIGLDFYWSMDLVTEQESAFILQIELAKKYNSPIVIHCRDSFKRTVEILKPLLDDKLTGIFHCFSGSLEDAEEIIEMGFLLGIGGVVTFKNGGLEKVLPFIDLQHLVLETDSPYLAPVPYRGKRNEPAYLNLIANKIAVLKNIDVKEVEKVTDENALKLFKYTI